MNKKIAKEISAVQNIETRMEQVYSMVLAAAYAVAENGIGNDDTRNILFGIAEFIEGQIKELNSSIEAMDRICSQEASA